MKRRIIIILAIVLVFVLLACYFHVKGTEIKGIHAISEDYTCTIRKEAVFGGEENQYTLDSDQIMALRELILDTNFTRRISNGFSYTGPKTEYCITLECTGTDGRELDFIYIICVDNLYCQISLPYQNQQLHLNIHNSHWQESLEHILSNNP